MVNIIFIVDIFVNLFSAYQDEDLSIENDIKVSYKEMLDTKPHPLYIF
jgi:hypothetical protein